MQVSNIYRNVRCALVALSTTLPQQKRRSAMKFGYLKCAAVALVASMMFAGTTNASVIVDAGSVFNWTISMPTPVGDGSEGLVGTTLSISNVSGNSDNNPQAIDLGPGDGSGSFGIRGALHQENISAIGTTPQNDGGVIATSIDSHFSYDPNDASISNLFGPGEDVGAATSTEAALSTHAFAAFSQTSFGSYLQATTVVLGAAPQTIDVAYIVVKADAEISVAGEVATSGRAGSASKQAADFTFSLLIPEPTTTAMISVGLMMLGASRNRRSV